MDFKINKTTGTILCDVKEVLNCGKKNSLGGEVRAYQNIREDISALRNKFRKNSPGTPVVLVTINFSSQFFTGFTVVKAMYGDIGAEFYDNGRSEIMHLPRGNASMTVKHHTLISGVLVFDCYSNNHTYFPNEFSKINFPSNYFPGVKEVCSKRLKSEIKFAGLSKIMFWPCKQ